ncbi:hypothetical protein ACQ4PT_046371 [Festuca glaucescens]
MARNELSIKLLINSKTNKLCFTEAGSDVVEFLTSLLSLPLGTVTSLLAKEHMAGSIGTLLGSAERMGASYNFKERHLSPDVTLDTLSRLQLLLGIQLNGSGKLYMCLGKGGSYPYSGQRTNCGFLSACYGKACPSCGSAMNNAMTLLGGGTNKSVVVAAAGMTPTYTLKDDLSVTPAESLSVITLLAQCGVKDLSVLQEKVVKIGKKEVLGVDYVLGSGFY